MCFECGCGRPGPAKFDGKPGDEVDSPLLGRIPSGDEQGSGEWESLPHSHASHLSHLSHFHAPRVVPVHESLFAANDRIAGRNRDYFRGKKLFVLNVVSSPGSGKTTLLTKTIEMLGTKARTGVIVGDLETDNDARRLRATGAPVVQVTTGTLCHLDAEMIARAYGGLHTHPLDILFIENVGNLVCPAEFDLGEDLRVAMLCVTEGEDKPLKYPPIFRRADVVVITKTDMALAAGFDRETALANLRRVNPKARIFEVSARSGEGMDEWCACLLEMRAVGRSDQ